MATVRPFYAGDKVSAKQFNELVCAIECLCSQMKNLQRSQRGSTFQNATTQHRYRGQTEGDDLSFNAVRPLATEQKTEVLYLCNGSVEREFLPFSLGTTPNKENYYLLEGAVFDGKDLRTYCAVCIDTQHCSDVWLSSCADGGFYCTCAMRNGTALVYHGQAVHHGSGVVKRNCAYGYGVVNQNRNGLNEVYVSRFPFHIYKQGIDVYAGGCFHDSSLCGTMGFVNAIGVSDFQGFNIGFPATEAIYFATAYDGGSLTVGGWYARGKLGCGGCIASVGRPRFNEQIMRASICLRASYCNPDHVRISGYYQQVDTSWTMTVPVAYTAVNCADGLVCVRMLEQEILVAPSTMFTQFCGRYVVNDAGLAGEQDLPEVCAYGCDPRKVLMGTTNVPRCVYQIWLPTSIPENCFGFPSCSVS